MVCIPSFSVQETTVHTPANTWPPLFSIMFTQSLADSLMWFEVQTQNSVPCFSFFPRMVWAICFISVKEQCGHPKKIKSHFLHDAVDNSWIVRLMSSASTLILSIPFVFEQLLQ